MELVGKYLDLVRQQGCQGPDARQYAMTLKSVYEVSARPSPHELDQAGAAANQTWTFAVYTNFSHILFHKGNGRTHICRATWLLVPSEAMSITVDTRPVSGFPYTLRLIDYMRTPHPPQHCCLDFMQDLLVGSENCEIGKCSVDIEEHPNTDFDFLPGDGVIVRDAADNFRFLHAAVCIAPKLFVQKFGNGGHIFVSEIDVLLGFWTETPALFRVDLLKAAPR